MRIAYTTTFDARDIHQWSGTPFHMSHAFSNAGHKVEYIGKLKRKLPPFFKVQQTFSKWISNQRESPRFNLTVAKNYSEQVYHALKSINYDVVISPLINPIAYLDCNKPIILWTDAVYSALLGFYPPFNHHSARTIEAGNAMTAACLSRVKLAIFSSEWAARGAIELYGINKNKVKVVPFGANLLNPPSDDEVKNAIKNRSQNKISLLFLAKSWERKGGDIVLAVAKKLYDAGVSVELNIVGITPKHLKIIPPYVKCLGFISKHTEEGKNKLHHLLLSSHFLFVPSKAEAYGIVFCEANAYGVPCLTTHVGGIGTVIKNDVNGFTFGLDDSIATYCEKIIKTMENRALYENLCLSAHHEFKTRLNWNTSCQTVERMILESK